MRARLTALYRRGIPLYRHLGLLDKIFLVLLILAVAGRYLIPATTVELLLVFAAFITGVIVFFRTGFRLMMKLVIWRLRYRLMVAYLFIAVVPIVLILFVVGFAADMLAGQMAAYLVTAELDRRTEAMEAPARELAVTPADTRLQQARWLASYLRDRYPGFEMLIAGDVRFRFPGNAGIQQPPPGWGDTSGLMVKDGRLYLWAHVKNNVCEVTMLAPMSQDALSELVPNLGELTLARLEMVDGGSGQASTTRLTFNRLAVPRRSRNRVPPPVNQLDAEVASAAPVAFAVWDKPGQMSSQWLFLNTRYSAVLRKLFGPRADWAENLTMYLQALIGLLLMVELVSVYIGVKLTRSITYAVHNLYEGTQRVRVGDFSHRIEVRGTDQLAELGESFNRMTENLERLVEVAKEKERLQSEIEIAREVQNQLFPRSVPPAQTLELAAVCKPARLVSGDYYDYTSLHDSNIAFAIGDVAGKGISAALLMATVQSSMRAQLRAGRELAVAAGDSGGVVQRVSTAALVSRLNQQLHAFTPAEKFATFFFSLYDDDTGLLTYTNAGHLPPILVRNGSASRLDVNGTVVGAFSFAQYDESTIQLNAGDLLVCFTDGITEPENEFGEMYGEDRLAELLVKNASRPAEEIMESVLDSVRVWTGSPELQDDMTLLLARRS